MATKLFLRQTTTNGIGSGYLDMLTTAGVGGAGGASVATTASGTEIQFRDGGQVAIVQWISGRTPAGGFTLTATDISVWCQESNMSANCGGRYRVFKRTNAGVETEIAGGPFNDGIEFSLAPTVTEMTWTGNVTDTAFEENDRILLKVYITNVGTMAGGHNCDLGYDGADGASNDSFFNIAETVTFKAEDVASGVYLPCGDVSSIIELWISQLMA